MQKTTGATGATGAPTLSFQNNTGPLAFFPPLNTEATIASVTESVIAGERLKIDYAFGVEVQAHKDSLWETRMLIQYLQRVLVPPIVSGLS